MKKKLLITILCAIALLSTVAFASCGKKESQSSGTSNGSYVESPDESESDTQSGSQSESASATESEKPSDTASGSDSQSGSGNGTQESPYLIKTAEDLLNFADMINEPDDENYASSYFRLEADIDMSGEKYVSAGQPKIETENGISKVTGGFSGTFDGNGHTVSNLEITKNLRSGTSYIGLFGYTYKATIRNLTLENIFYSIESMNNSTGVGVNVGGVVGYAELTNFSNVKISGTIETKLMDQNAARIGGIVGSWEIYDPNQAYIAFIRNCSTNVSTEIADFEDGEKSSLANAANGGIVGSLSCNNGAAAIVNSAALGRVNGGQFAGGIIGYASGNNVTVVDCVNSAYVRATAKDVSYAGGIIGSANGDMLALDCYSSGRIVAVKATDSNYKSYVGGIFGYSRSDDYDGYYTAGVVASDCYYSGALSGYDIKNSVGVEIAKASVNKEWFKTTLAFDENKWTFSVDGETLGVVPKNDDGLSGTYKLSMYANGELVEEIEKPYNAYGYSIIGELENAENSENSIFFDWEFTDGVRYRYYFPVVKNIRLNAKFGDITDMVSTYKGVSDYNGGTDSGIIALYADGTLEWVTTSVVNGTYTTDGEHLIMTLNNNYGEVTGSYNSATGVIKFTIEHGITATVEYTFTKTDVKVFGQYFNKDGDMLAFTDNTLTLYSSNVRDNDGVSVGYTVDGNNLVIAKPSSASTSSLFDYFSSMNVTVLENGALYVKFVGSKGYSIDCNFERPSAVDYSQEKFVGKYHVPYISLSIGDPYQTDYVLEFFADGHLTYTGAYSVIEGSYYVFNGKTFKFLLEGNMSEFEYDVTENIFYGVLNRGVKRYTVATPYSGSAHKAFIVGDDIKTFVLVSENKYYYINNGVYMPNVQISVSNNFAENDRVMINGKAYRALYYAVGRENGYRLSELGKEEGTYGYNGEEYSLDGINLVGGAKSGKYCVYGNLVVIAFDDDTFLGFDYTLAQSSAWQITAKTPDGIQGVWYEYKEDTTDPDNPVMRKYHKLMIDGFGHATYVYNRDFEGEWHFNWGGENVWRNISETDIGVYCEFNENFKVEFGFYYNGQLAYCKNFGSSGVLKLVKEGYTGTTDLPVLPSEASGTYSGNEADGTAVVFNLKQDLSGSFKGLPFVAIFDGEDLVFFTINGVDYKFSIESKTLSYNSQNVVLTRGGDVQEVIPALFVGTWSGVWEGYGTTENDTRSIKIESDGTLVYNSSVSGMAVFDAETNTITCETAEGDYKIVLTWDSVNSKMSGVINYTYDGGEYSASCSSLKKA